MTGWLLALALSVTPAPSALERAAADVSKLLVEKQFSAPMGVYVEGTPAPLSRALASLVAARLTESKLDAIAVEAHDASFAERAAREAGVVSLVRLTVGVEGARLVVRGDALVTRRNFWSGDLPIRSGAATAIAVSLDADAEAQTLAGGAAATSAPVPLELRATSLLKGPVVPAAIAVCDLDGDKKAEIVVLAQERVAVFSGEGKLLAKADLSTALSGRPTREPFGLISTANGRVVVWSGKREKPEVFFYSHGTLRSQGTTDSFSVEALGVKVEPSFNRASPEVVWSGRALTLPLGPQTVSAFGPVVFFAFPDGTGAVARGVAPTARVSGVGSASVVGDLDGDGAAEILVTSAKTLGDTDEVRVFSLSAFDAMQARGGVLAEGSPLFQLPLKGRAVVAAAGDVDGDGADEVVLGVWNSDGTGELVLVKRVAP